MPKSGAHVQSLAEVISDKFICELIRQEVNEDERNRYALPVKKRGQGIPDLVQSADVAYDTSKAAKNISPFFAPFAELDLKRQNKR